MKATPNDMVNLSAFAVRNGGGGFVNHALFWESLKPQGVEEPAESCEFSNEHGVHINVLPWQPRDIAGLVWW